MMDATGVALGFVLMLGLMALGLHIATVMFAVGAIGAGLYFGMPAINALGVVYFESMNDSLLLALPLFILLGEILVRCGSTDQMYRSLSDWLNPLPGGLLHTNVASSALVLGGVGFLGRHRGDHRHGGAAVVQDAQVQHADGAGLDRGGRVAGQPHPARHRLHHLWRADQHLGRPALCRGRAARRDPHRDVHALHRRAGDAQSGDRPARAGRRSACRFVSRA